MAIMRIIHFCGNSTTGIILTEGDFGERGRWAPDRPRGVIVPAARLPSASAKERSMFKRLAFIAVLAGIGAAAALAAPLPANVQSTAADTVVVVVKFEKPEWMKTGLPVRVVRVEKELLIGKSMIIDVADTTITVLTPKGKAKNLKPGAGITLDKPRAGMAGC